LFLGLISYWNSSTFMTNGAFCCVRILYVQRLWMSGNGILYVCFIYYCFYSGLYYGVTISLVSFATGLSVVTLNIHHRGMRGRRLPPLMRRLIFDYLAKFLLLKLEMPKRAYLFKSMDDKCFASDGEQCSTDCNNAAFTSAAAMKASVLRRRIPVVNTYELWTVLLTLWEEYIHVLWWGYHPTYH